MTVDELLAQFLVHQAAQNHTQRTIDWYEYQINRFLKWLVANDLQATNWLSIRTIERYLASPTRKGQKPSPATVAGHYRALHGFLGWLAETGAIESSPLAGTKAPRVPSKQPNRVSLEEYDRLIGSIDQGTWIELRDRLIINVLFLSGLRLSECASLTAADFRTQEHLLVVRCGKGGHQRLVPLLPATERAYVAYLFVKPAFDDPRLFLAANGAKEPCGVLLPNGIRQMLRRRCANAGMRRLNPHAFRHGLAMHLLNEGGDMSLVQKILGHSQISTTARHYAEWLTAGVVREFSEKMRGIGR